MPFLLLPQEIRFMLRPAAGRFKAIQEKGALYQTGPAARL
jgi:hypothetical protein